MQNPIAPASGPKRTLFDRLKRAKEEYRPKDIYMNSDFRGMIIPDYKDSVEESRTGRRSQSGSYDESRPRPFPTPGFLRSWKMQDEYSVIDEPNKAHNQDGGRRSCEPSFARIQEERPGEIVVCQERTKA